MQRPEPHTHHPSEPGSPENTCPPHSPQKDFGSPVSGRQVRSEPWPATTVTPVAGRTAFVLHGVPARRWQRVQWQWPAVVNSAVTWNSTVPHAQDPLSGASGDGMSGSLRLVGKLLGRVASRQPERLNGRYRSQGMHNARIDTTQGLDGEAVVLAVFDLPDEEIAASAHAVKVFSGERFRTASMSTDEVLELRELTALADELGDLLLRPGVSTLVMRPARLNAWRDALTYFVESRDEAEWMREEDREPLALVRGLLWPLGDLCADAMRAALTPPAPKTC